jgi:uroporphyrinogen decarboxylase
MIAAANHREPDKVPIDLGGSQCSTLTLVANDRLKEYLKIDTAGEVITALATEAISPLEEILTLFEVDCRMVLLKAPSDNGGVAIASSDIVRTPPGHEFTDDLGTVWKKNLYDYAPMYFPFENLSVSDLDKYPWPNPHDPGRVKGLREEVDELREQTDYAIVGGIIIGGPFEQACRSRGAEKFFTDLALEPKFAEAFLAKLTDLAIGMWDAELSAIGDLVDVVCQGDDIGMQTGLQISPEMYKRFVKPCHERLFSFIHSKTKAKLWLHSCGSVYSVIPDLIETGVDILNPVQVGAKNMGLKKLKREFGRDLVFWGGGIDIQKLPYMSIAQIKDCVKEAIDIMAPGGGYVFAATHNILPDTTGDRTYTAFMTAVQNRDYNKRK